MDKIFSFCFLILILVCSVEVRVQRQVLSSPRCTISSNTNFADSTDKSGTLPLPRCVTSIENIMTGRFRSGITGTGVKVIRPPWFNETLATLGQRFASKHLFSLHLGMLAAQMIVAAQNDTSHVAFHTGGLASEEKAQKRFASNTLQSKVWFETNLHSNSSNMFESFNRVKAMHLVILDDLVRRKRFSSRVPEFRRDVWEAVHKDLESSPIRNRKIPAGYYAGGDDDDGHFAGMNQFAMASVLWGFSGVPMIRPQEFGIPLKAATDEELEGYLHFWAFIAHCLGVEDEFNICLQPDVATARIYYERFLNEILVPLLFHRSGESKEVTQAFYNGFTQSVGPTVQFNFVMVRALEDIVGIPTPHILDKMSTTGRANDWLWRQVLRPGLKNSRNMGVIVDSYFENHVEKLSSKVFGFDGTNNTIVARHAFSW